MAFFGKYASKTLGKKALIHKALERGFAFGNVSLCLSRILAQFNFVGCGHVFLLFCFVIV
jgi:hypothetical protein